MSNQVEDDLNRVLRLARAEARTQRRKVVNKTVNTKRQQREPPQRHRHGQRITVSREERSTLLTAKLKGLSAIYGIDSNSRRLGDCANKSAPRQEDDDNEMLQQRLDARRALYKQHYAGVLSSASSKTRTIENLLEAAAKEAKASRPMGVGIGAAILTTTNTIFTASAIENNAMSLCAERAVVLKTLTSGKPPPTIEAIAICSEQLEMLPFPCGGCRELLANCGDFPVYLVNSSGESEETRSSALFPRARHSEMTQRVRNAEPSSSRPRRSTTTSTPSSQVPVDVKDWSIDHVLQWLETDVELPQYREVFERNAVDGCTLVLLEASDLQLLLGISHPVHRSKLLTHVDRLRDRELLARGLDYTQLEDYLSVLDIDRVSAVAQLKTTFDRLDADRDGFLDFNQVKQALSRLRCTIPTSKDTDSCSVEASAQAVERLLRSEELFGKEAANSGKVSFQAFTRAFSKLAMQPADTAGVTNGAFAVHALGPRLPILNVTDLSKCFDQRAGGASDASLGEAALIQLLQELGQTNSASVKVAREWLQLQDGVDESKETLNFAQFTTRYAQLMDPATEKGEASGVARLQQIFTSFEPVTSTRWKPHSVVQRALSTLFPAVPRDEINVWCAANSPTKPSRVQATSTMSFPEFTLACLEFAAENHQREQEASSIKCSLRNDALAHRSRVVHLHQSGHVRMCPQPREDVTEGNTQKLLKQSNSGKQSTRRRRNCDDDDGKCADNDGKAHDSDEDEPQRNRKCGQRESQVDDVFNRFAQRHKSRIHTKGNDAKQDSDGDEDDECNVLNAVEAAQAALELGAAFSREQVMRFLEREGLGRLRRRDISRMDFHRLIKRLDANQTHPREFLLELDDYSAPSKASKDSTKDRSSSKSPRHRAYKSKMDYDEFLRQKHAMQNGSQWEKEVAELRHKQQHKEKRRYKKSQHRHRSDRDDSDDDGKHDSDSSGSESSSSSGNEGGYRTRRRTRTRSSRSRSRSRNTRATRRGRRHRNRSASTASTASDTSSNESERSIEHRSRRRGFQPGTRVVSMFHGRGTIERVYRDYFVADVHFDSGRHLRNVEFSSIRILSPEDENDAPKRGFNVGTLVTIAHKGTKARRRGKIILCRTDGTFDILINEFGLAQTLKRIARSALEFVNSKATIFREGARVTVRQRTEYLRGRICVCRTDGSYDVKLARSPQKILQRLAPELLSPDDEEDGGSDDGFEVDEIESPTAPKETGRPNQNDSDDEFEPDYSRGDRVEARFGGQAAYYPGTIERVHSNGACDISYDDGDEEERVAPRLIRPLKRTTETRKATTMKKKSGNDSDGYESDLFESD